MIDINEQWSIESNKAGGFNLIEKIKGVSKKTGEPITRNRKYFYPNLSMVSAKLVEKGWDNEAESINKVIDAMALYTSPIVSRLEQLIGESE